MIFTSYFRSKAPQDRKVSIAKWPGRFWTGPRANLFAPSDPKALDWKGSYMRDLETRFPTAEKLQEYLSNVEAEVKDPILCCFEDDASQCHRHILAAFIKEQLGIDVSEWVSGEPIQGSLL